MACFFDSWMPGTHSLPFVRRHDREGGCLIFKAWQPERNTNWIRKIIWVCNRSMFDYKVRVL